MSSNSKDVRLLTLAHRACPAFLPGKGNQKYTGKKKTLSKSAVAYWVPTSIAQPRVRDVWTCIVELKRSVCLGGCPLLESASSRKSCCVANTTLSCHHGLKTSLKPDAKWLLVSGIIVFCKPFAFLPWQLGTIHKLLNAPRPTSSSSPMMR